MITNPLLEDYIVAASSAEPALLKQLRAETAQATGAPHMLSGPVEGTLLGFLVQLSRATRCLEIGTFTGYSALHIARGLDETGTLVTCEQNPKNAAIAQRYFDLSPDGHKIKLVLGDAIHTLQTPTLIGEQPFDFAFLDANKREYPKYYDLIVPLLNSGGLLVIDNALWRGEVITPNSPIAVAINQLNHQARQDSRVETVMLSVRDGILLVRKK